MDLPVSLAILIAFLSSAAATIGGRGEVYFDSVVMFVFFLSASRYFEDMARQRCAATTLAPDDRVLIRPGETVPADGEIESGQSAIDESLLSGESLPLARGPGERLLGGSINITNPLQMRVSAVGADTVMAEIQRTIERAQADKPPMARLADRVAAHFIGIVLSIVVCVAVFWWWHDPTRWFGIALAVLIVSCPCALSLATPTAISATLGRMQSAGLLVKQAAALEKLNHITHVVFDKTGTLTRGEPALEAIVCNPDFDQTRCLELAATLERYSEHPLARVLVRTAGTRDRAKPSNIVSVAGGGISATIDGRQYYIGSREFISGQTEVEIPAAWQDAIDGDAVSIVLLARSDCVLAMFTFSDPLRDEARELVDKLRQMGKSILLMTGDRRAAAARVAAATGIDDYRARMSPRDKMEAVQALQADGARVLMVGDGVNDAPVLARADVSIAMGGASSLAKTSAEIVLIANHLQAVAEAIRMARKTRSVIRQNMTWALMYNFGAIPAAALGLVAPWLAAIGMSASSLIVVINAMRLTR